MRFVELEEKEFEKFALDHEQISFHQSKEWAKLKKSNNWDSHYVGLKKNNKVVAATLLLSKNIKIKKKMFYAPRGFLIDYSDYDVLEFFTKEIKKYVKNKDGFFIKIDPYLIYKERDINGDFVENGINNHKAVENLKKLNYIHHGFSIDYSSLQPRFIFWLPLEGKSEEDVWNNFSKDTKRHINKTKKHLLVIEETNADNIDDFCGIMEHTSKRRGFIDRPKQYYLEMLKSFKNNIKILSAVLYVDKALEYWKDEKKKLKKEKVELENKISETNSKKSKDLLKSVNKSLDEVLKNIEDLNNLDKLYGNRIVMASSMFIIYGREVLYLFSGSYDEFMKYNAQYSIQWNMIKYAIENKYERYNFYGIEGVFDSSNGVYEFKKGFDGQVVEFIGEFDLVLNSFYYYLYKFGFGLYRNIKHLKQKLIGGKK